MSGRQGDSGIYVRSRPLLVGLGVYSNRPFQIMSDLGIRDNKENAHCFYLSKFR